MSQEITDAMLDEQTEHLTSLFAMAGYGTFTQAPERVFCNVTRAALEVERACYYTLKEALSIAMRDASEHEDLAYTSCSYVRSLTAYAPA